MTTRPPNWDDLLRREVKPLEPDDFAKLTARVFGTRDGEEWLAQVAQRKFWADQPSEISQSALVHLEGQRQFLRDIRKWVAQAKAQPPRKG